MKTVLLTSLLTLSLGIVAVGAVGGHAAQQVGAQLAYDVDLDRGDARVLAYDVDLDHGAPSARVA